MKNLLDMATIQIEITNHCIRQCSNCSRHVGHHKEPYFMTFDCFKNAVDSMVGFPRMTGIQGGEPLLHPEFEKFCKYLSSKIEPKKLGLWTTLPKGYEHYRELIVDTFHHIFINNHTLGNIYHHPPLVAIKEVIEFADPMWFCIDRCWAQKAWSASINPKGAFFCEIAAAMSILYDEGEGWEVEPNWWWRIPKDYKEQMEQWCPRCGFAAPLPRRSSLEDVDDISPDVLKYLKDKSPKIMEGRYVVSDLKTTDIPQPLAAYKDFEYRSRIAKTYGMFLILNDSDFLTPYLYKDFKI